jgi:type IV pilus assembly protein PilB
MIEAGFTPMAEQEENFPDKEPIGAILLKRQKITNDQLNKALSVQRKEGGYLGENLIKLGFVDEIDVVVALIVQCNLPYIAVDKYEIDKSILQLIPQLIAEKFRLIPLERVGDVLTVVMADPFDTAAKAEIKRVTGCRVAPFIATKSEITGALKRWYGVDTKQNN